MAHADTTSGGESLLATQHPDAYEAARELILAGVPCFVAPRPMWISIFRSDGNTRCPI